MTLRRFVIKRFLVLIPVLLGVTFMTFMMTHLLPGDPIEFMTQFADVSQETKETLRRKYNLHLPIWQQYLLWLADAVQLNFGESIVTNRNVDAAVMSRLPYTVLLGVSAWLIAMVIAVPAGMVAAYNNGDVEDEVSRIGALLGISIPNFWLGLMLLMFFSVGLGWFSVIPPTDSGILSLEMLKFTLLPAVTIGTASTALLMRLMRSSMVEQLNKDYVTMARAKGLSERTVVVKHVLRNSLIAVVTVAALQIAFIVDGAVVTETVFSYPGMGRMLINAIVQRDFPIIQASVLMIGVAIVVANLIADLVYAWLDPRIRY